MKFSSYIVIFGLFILVNIGFAFSNVPPALPSLQSSENSGELQKSKEQQTLKPRTFVQKLLGLVGLGNQNNLETDITIQKKITEQTKQSADDQEPFIDLNGQKLPQTKNKEIDKNVDIAQNTQIVDTAELSKQPTHEMLSQEIANLQKLPSNSDVGTSNGPLAPMPQQQKIQDNHTQAQSITTQTTANDKADNTLSTANLADKQLQENNGSLPNLVSVNSKNSELDNKVVENVRQTIPQKQEEKLQSEALKSVQVKSPNEPAVDSLLPPPVIQNYTVNDIPAAIKNSNNKTIQPRELNDKDNKLSTDDDHTSEQSKFVSNEAKVILLPNDDVVLGVLAEQAKIDYMDFRQYIATFEKLEDKAKILDKQQMIKNFIANYDIYFNSVNPYSLKELKDYTFDAVTRDNLVDLRALMDNYHILQITDKNGNTLLHKSLETEDYALVKFLVMRGINLSAYNVDHKTALMIAEEQNNENVAGLLRRASGL